MIRRLLRGAGLATRGELDAAEAKLREVRARLEKATARLSEAGAAAERVQESRREEARRFKTRIAELESDQRQHADRHKEAAASASRQIEQLAGELRQRDLHLEASLRQETELERRLAAAQQDLETARASLSAIEVKLDILEGAANVLDVRTRTSTPREG